LYYTSSPGVDAKDGCSSSDQFVCCSTSSVIDLNSFGRSQGKAEQLKLFKHVISNNPAYGNDVKL